MMVKTSIESKHVAIDRAMEEGARQSQSDIGKYIKGHKMTGKFGMDYIPVEGICINVFFSHSVDAIVYTIEDNEGKRHNIYSFCINSKEEVKPIKVKTEEVKEDPYKKLQELYKKYNQVANELLGLYDKQLDCLKKQIEILS